MTYTKLRQSTYKTTVRFCLLYLFQGVKTLEMLCLLLSDMLKIKSFSEIFCFFHKDIFTYPYDKKMRLRIVLH